MEGREHGRDKERERGGGERDRGITLEDIIHQRGTAKHRIVSLKGIILFKNKGKQFILITKEPFYGYISKRES